MFSKHVSPNDLFYCDLWSGYTIMYNTFSQRPWYKLSSRWYFIGFPNSVGIFFVFNLSFPLLFLLIIQIPVRALARCFKEKLSSFASLSSLGSDRRLQKIDLFSNGWNMWNRGLCGNNNSNKKSETASGLCDEFWLNCLICSWCRNWQKWKSVAWHTDDAWT